MKASTLATVALLLGCIGLLQWHAMQFWAAAVDPITGPAFAIVLEGAALWLWSHRRRALRALAAPVTLLVLAGPLYHLAAPVLHEWRSIDRGEIAAAERRAELRAEIASAEIALAGYLRNSEHRIGWAGRIDRAETRLDTARAELADLTRGSAEAPARADWQSAAIVGLQALAIIVLQLVGVLAIRELRERRAHYAATNWLTPDHPRPAKSPARPRVAVVTPLRRPTA